jgi:hypothetical protein
MMTARETQIAEFRAKAELTGFVTEWLEDFLIKVEMDEGPDNPPFDPKTALIELSAEAMTQAILEDGKEVRGIIGAIMARFYERIEEIERFRRRAAILHESVALRERGATLAEIGSVYGVTRQRVHQMLDGVNINPQRWLAQVRELHLHLMR